MTKIEIHKECVKKLREISEHEKQSKRCAEKIENGETKEMSDTHMLTESDLKLAIRNNNTRIKFLTEDYNLLIKQLLS